MSENEIHEADFLYKFIEKLYGTARAQDLYFSGGKADAAQIAAAATRFCDGPSLRVLEFASGYGRVTRHLPDLMPRSKIVAADIHSQACDFIAQTFGVETVHSSTDPNKLSVGVDFDFIFVVSLFSHLPNRSFASWMKSLYSILAPKGILLFTTHGEKSKLMFEQNHLKNQESGDGWVYLRQSDQTDLDLEDYGTMLVTPSYVVSAISTCGAESLRSFESGAWFGHQDEWVLQKPG